MSTREIAEKACISNGTAYYVVTALIEKGYLKFKSFKNNPRKKQYTYLLTRKGIREKAALTKEFINLKRLEFEYLQKEIKLLEKELLDNNSSSDRVRLDNG